MFQIFVLAVISAVWAEAPYNLPRPGPNALSIQYAPIRPLPQPIQVPQLQQTFQQYPQRPQVNFPQNNGYQYQQPNIGPTFVQPGYIAPQIQYNQQQYQQPQYQQPNQVYGSPFLRQPAPQQPLPAPAIQPGYIQQQIGISQFPQNAYSYSAPQPINQSPLVYSTPQSSYSSYQADNSAYQRSSGPLDSVVVDRVQNILTENEHTSARNAGYLSLVSGVALEGARPSLEISSFVQNSPLNQGPSLSELARGGSGRSIQSSGQSVSTGSPSAGYGLPTVTANSAQSNQGNFLPQTQASTSYGAPN